MPATVISIINNKGGVGKTTSSSIISQILAILGKRVLLVDLDPQSNLSMMVNTFVIDSDDVINGIEPPAEPNIHELFKYRLRTKEDIIKLIKPTSIPNLFIIPSSKRHKNTPLAIKTNETGNNNILLKKALQTIQDDFDFIIIDNAPANDILTVNSIFASSRILIPVRLERFSYEGLRETLNTLLYIKEEHDIQSIDFCGAFVTQAEVNTNLYKDLNDNYISELGEKFLQTPIRKDIHVGELETNFIPIFEYSPNTNAIYDYSKLIIASGILDKEYEKKLSAAIGE